ncbi:SUKH-4 family immunity protein [Streptomyces oryzae]|uniref:SUKH-4 family immunity protein n=1 Tax=Streptomyces oryzae TaxID=1434886 RepID=A0ABS3XJU8_9ACTN|nr:SUKH-4 family immunity protein [Streptomyces oryzae]MBO8195678.1 SUKH-4 family immunity protein [Streptomyces oryzae]
MSSPMVPQRLPGRLYAAFHAVGLEWPDLPLERYAALARTAREAGSRLVDGTAARQLAGQARVLEAFVRAMSEAENAFHQELQELTEEHGGPVGISRHRDHPCVTQVRDRWREHAAATVEHAFRVRTEHLPLTVELLERTGAVPLVPDYADADACPWLPGLAAAGAYDGAAAPTAGRSLAAEALLRWSGDLCGPAVCVLTGASGAGKTHLLSWFTDSTFKDWASLSTGGPVSSAAVPADGRDVAECVARVLRAQFAGDGSVPGDGDLSVAEDADYRALLSAVAGRGEPLTVTVADLGSGPEAARLVEQLIRPLAEVPCVRVLVEARDPAVLAPVRHAVLDLDDPRLTDPAAFAAWYEAAAATLPGASPFAPEEIYPNVGLAAIAARARGSAADAPGPAVDERVCAAWLDGHGAPARDAAATLSLAQGPMTESVWRLLHCARHPDDTGAASAAVDAAAAALPTVEPGTPVYALRPACLVRAAARLLPPAPGGNAAHHRDAVAVMAGWPVSERLGPADYVTEHLPAHVRRAGLAGPGDVPPRAPCPPPVRVTRPLLEEVFGEDGLLRLPARLLHPRMTHGPTRRFLTEVGIPAGGIDPHFWADTPLRCHLPVSEEPAWQEVSERLRAAEGLPGPLEDLFHLDFLVYGDLLLDGRTGLVYEVDEGFEGVLPAHRDLESYAYLMYALHRGLRRWRVDAKDAHRDARYWVADDLVLALRAYDPLPFADPERIWAGHFDDLADGIWSPGTPE